ncbi:MAG: P-loop NTPase fold protein [Hydrogenophaga sp.]|nr:P-loop NTPase fold protein [Hydrogenophaga sp.]MDP3923877.1 P-loop NTPase fold protein [Hydrogenophaga sp.]
MNNTDSGINFDIPLEAANALQRDKLDRTGYAESAAAALRRVSSSAGLVVSIEGAWGSGKTSTLAMIEAILTQPGSAHQPLIVHFNPWLVGEKDALLRHFLSRIAGAINLSDHSRDGKKVAKEIKAYSKAFDLVKLIPGAEPWTSLIKSVFDAVGDATGSIAEYKTPDIATYKQKVEEALRQFQRPIIVFIDDIDRLFPNEVFEMIRIIKAVGELPHVGYVLAWDSAYVSSALEKLGVPYAGSYLDKVVQIRMPLPSLSRSARRKLIKDALDELPPEALVPRFKEHDQRLSGLYYSGLRELLDQPRDMARVFNAVRMIEPSLRGEIVFADILGIAALSVKAPTVFELLRRNPRLFVGWLVDDQVLLEKSEDVIKSGACERKLAYDASGSPLGVQRVVHYLFPLVAKAEGSYALGHASYVDGTIAHPARLAVALQLSVTSGDVSLEAAKRYLQQPEQRLAVIGSLTTENCDAFLELLGDVAQSLGGEGIVDLDDLCMSIAGLPEQALFVDRAKVGKESIGLNAEDNALRAVVMLLKSVAPDRMEALAERIAADSRTLSCAAEIVTQSYVPQRQRYSEQLTAPTGARDTVLQAFAANVLKAAQEDHLFQMNNPGFILWTLARSAPADCPAVYAAVKAVQPSLDNFALEFLRNSWDSTSGQTYSLPRDESLQSVYCPLVDFKAHAASRLEDETLRNPAKAAWRSVVEEKNLYGVDGSEARR